MRVAQQTIDALSKRGITIRPTFHDFDAQLKKEWQWSYNYCSTGTPESEKIAQADNWVKDIARRSRQWWDNSDTLYIFEGDTIYEMKNLPKYNETTLADIEKRIERERKKYNSPYGNFCRKMQSLLSEDQINQGFTIYPTTYGIGIMVIYNWHAEKCISLVETAMNKRGIEYYNEFSDKRWVYRFKVSKKAGNLAKLV